MKNIFRLSIALLLLLFITPKAFSNTPEQLLGIALNFDKKEITITVVSSGCTQKNDFEFIFKDGALTIGRKKKDACKALPSEISFTYSLTEAGIDPNKPFTITNPFIANYFMAQSN